MVVVAGFLADDAIWAGFVDRWDAFLSQHDLKVFHACEFWARKSRPYNSWSDDKHKCVEDDVSSILAHVPLFGFAIAVHVPSFSEWRIEQDHHVREDPYYFCLDKCLRFLIADVKKSYGEDDGIAVYIDQDQSRERFGLELASRHEARVRRGLSYYVGYNRQVSVQYVPKFRYRPLQAADILANELFRTSNLILSGRNQTTPWLVAMERANVPIRVELFNNRELLDIDARGALARHEREKSLRKRGRRNQSTHSEVLEQP
jgi:hypothetical protein